MGTTTRTRLLSAVAAAGIGLTALTACTPPGPLPPPTTGGPTTTAALPGTPLPPGPVTVVALGDSLTEGSGDDTGRGYPGRIQEELDRGDRSGSNVVNLGRSGWSSDALIDGDGGGPSQLAQARDAIGEAQRAGRPAVALVLIGSNDLWYLYEFGPESGTTASDEGSDLDHYRTNLRRIVGELRSAGATVLLAINDDQSRRPVAADDARRRETFPGITRAEVGQMSVQAHRYGDAVRTVAADAGATVVDFLESPIFTTPATMSEDGNHPNAAGYDQMSQVWLTALRPLVA